MSNDPLKPKLGETKKPLLPPEEAAKPLLPAAGGKPIPLASGPQKSSGATIPLRPLEPRREGIPAALKEPRLTSLDAFRGFIMLMMASSGFAMGKVLQRLSDAGLTDESSEYRTVKLLAGQLEHVVWRGGVFWDLIQPAFMFMVGVALPYSYARRAARGDSYVSRLLHTLLRCIALVALGVFLANPSGGNGSTTVFTFANVLAQIGLGYLFVFLFVNRGVWLQAIAVAAILGGYWYAFYQHPLPPESFDYATVGIPATIKIKEKGETKEVPNPERELCILPGVQGHWSKNTNFAAAYDRDFLNRFQRTKVPPRRENESDEAYAARVEDNRKQHEFQFNSGGYATLNFVPSIATMLLGLMIGELLRKTGRSSGDKLITMLAAGAGCLALGLALHYAGVCPIVKRIWTPSWALASGGVVIWLLALFYLVFDHWGWRRLAWPLAIVGMNSIVMYMMSQLLKGWTRDALYTHLTIPYAKLAAWCSARTGYNYSPELFGGPAHPYQPLFESLAVLGVFWLVCAWLWRQRIFVKL